MEGRFYYYNLSNIVNHLPVLLLSSLQYTNRYHHRFLILMPLSNITIYLFGNYLPYNSDNVIIR